MTSLPDEIKKLLDPGQSHEPDPGPIQHLWVYNPVENVVHITHNDGRHPAYRITHKDHHPEITHESALRGFAFKIKGGWRIVDRESKEIDDPYVVSLVVRKLEGKPNPTPEEHPRYHGLPVTP
jgi:hypothetical protein